MKWVDFVIQSRYNVTTDGPIKYWTHESHERSMSKSCLQTKKSSVGIFNFYNQVRISLNYQSRTSYHLVVTKYFGENINNYIPQN